MPVLPSYRNPSIDVQSKSTDWFRYEGNTGFYWVNLECSVYQLQMYISGFGIFSFFLINPMLGKYCHHIETS